MTAASAARKTHGIIVKTPGIEYGHSAGSRPVIGPRRMANASGSAPGRSVSPGCRPSTAPSGASLRPVHSDSVESVVKYGMAVRSGTLTIAIVAPVAASDPLRTAYDVANAAGAVKRVGSPVSAANSASLPPIHSRMNEGDKATALSSWLLAGPGTTNGVGKPSTISVSGSPVPGRLSIASCTV